ncbi:phosphoribosylaminoimidazolesuccinocarboxamide synthase, partial [Candidatus Saccharibacteria bacterium]|nr:phosphoribosylaminoimidazolesuccinocarboxamide synthase [Candidatus Saccharibacteria bacterium]
RDGKILLADELLTPDSSRFWSAANYEPGQEQDSYDKQIIRNYIAAARERGDTNITIPNKILSLTAERYREACKVLVD